MVLATAEIMLEDATASLLRSNFERAAKVHTGRARIRAIVFALIEYRSWMISLFWQEPTCT